MLGKGANCALLDAVSLTERLEKPWTSTSRYERGRELYSFAVENVKRRLAERKRSALVQNIVYFGDNKFKEFWRNHSLKIALGWIEDPKGHA